MDQADVTSLDSQTTKIPMKPVAVGLAIFLFFPLGLYLLWRHPVLSRNKTWWWVGGVWSLFVFVSVVGGDKDKKPEAAKVAQATPARTPQEIATTEEDDAVDEPPSPRPKKIKKGVNLANYEQITDGMTREEVEAMLGKGRELASSGDEKAVVYESKNFFTGSEKFIEVHYLEGQVMVKFKDGF